MPPPAWTKISEEILDYQGLKTDHEKGPLETREVHLEWSAAVRLNHWLIAAAILVLIGTGFYISDPFTVYGGETTDKSLMSDVTAWHAVSGLALALLFIWRIYLAFFSRFRKDWRDFLGWTDWRCMIRQARFYLLLEKEEPEHAPCIFGPIQSLSYFVLWLGVFAVIATGFILMGANRHTMLPAAGYFIFQPLLKLMGNLAVVRYVHHVLTWFFILFIIVHVYMAVWYDAMIRDGVMSSIISGRRFKKIRPQSA